MMVRVLLVDDHEEARAALAARLARQPSIESVAEAANLALARQAVNEDRPDIILLDIQGHNGQGIALCGMLRALSVAPVVVLTSYITGELWAAARNAGAVDYLLKDINTEQLSRKIVALARRGASAPPGSAPQRSGGP